MTAEDSIAIANAFSMARDAISSNSWDDESRAKRLKEFGDALVEFERQAFFRGWELAGRIERREREENIGLLLQVTARLAGKDRADGHITFEVYPDPAIYGWANE